jgi:hypothetical protein
MHMRGSLRPQSIIVGEFSNTQTPEVATFMGSCADFLLLKEKIVTNA